MLINPYDAKDLAFALHETEGLDDRYYCIDKYDKNNDEFEKAYDIRSKEDYILLPNGELRETFNLEKVVANKQAIVDRVLDSMKDDDLILKGYTEQKRRERDELTSTAKDSNENKLKYIATCLQLTSAYTLLGYKLDELKNDKQADTDIIEAIKKQREEEIKEEEESQEITNELEMVNAMLRELLPKEKSDSIEIESCSYNGEEMSPRDITDRLATHMIPEFMTQVNILDTLDDQYEIVTNHCIISRAKGGEITIKDR
jgi:hypothetical protein